MCSSLRFTLVFAEVANETLEAMVRRFARIAGLSAGAQARLVADDPQAVAIVAVSVVSTGASVRTVRALPVVVHGMMATNARHTLIVRPAEAPEAAVRALSTRRLCVAPAVGRKAVDILVAGLVEFPVTTFTRRSSFGTEALTVVVK